MSFFSSLFRRKKDDTLEINDDVRAVSTERAEQSAVKTAPHLEAGEIRERELTFDPDIPDLWHDIRESQKRHISKPYTEEILSEVETRLGYKLPNSYLALMKAHNGGLLNRCRVAMPAGIEERVCVTGIFGVGYDVPYSLCGRFGSEFVTVAYRHNKDIGVAICNTLQPGRGVMFLDYRRCGRTGEPCVTYSDSVAGTETVVAKNFEQFLLGLTLNTIEE